MQRARAAGAATAILVGLAAVAALAPAAAAPAAARTVHTGKVDRFNVGATHSPALEHLLSARPAHSPTATRASAAGVLATTPTVQGIDVASFQHAGGPIIWSDVAAAQYKFAFIKVSEGSYYTNPYYASDATGAQGVGLFTAPYAFAIPNYSGGALQADYALDAANYAPNGRTLPLILDIEYDPYANKPPPMGDGTSGFCYGLSTTQMVAWIDAFVTEADRRMGQLPVIYTTAQWWDTCTGGSTAFAADPLWIAGNNSANTGPTMPPPWSNWTYWQYTNSAALTPGISGTFDASYLSASALELAAPASQSNKTGSTPANLSVNALDGTPTAASFTATGLPSGMSIDATSGVISGTLPATPGAFPVSITATAGGPSSTQSFYWRVYSGVSMGRLGSQTGTVGSPVRFQVPVSDGLTGCTLQLSASGLPHGLTMSSCGLISGWLTTSGQYQVSVQVTDSTGAVVAHGSFGWKVVGASGGGPAGHIRLSRDGKCLDELHPGDIAIETCSGAAAQRWTIAADGSVRINGMCLAAKAVVGTSTAPVALDVATCAKEQRWQLGSNAVLTNLSNHRCLADTGGANGSRAVAALCQATPNSTGSASKPSSSQQWTLPAGLLSAGIPRYCASDVRGSAPVGAVTLQGCKNEAQQAWTVQPNGTIGIAGQCLGLTGGQTTPGTLVRLGRCDGKADQTWQLPGGPIGVRVFSPLAGLCLADPRDRTTAGTQLIIGPCVAGDPGISWRVS